MKKTSTSGKAKRKLKPELKWQTGDYDRYPEYKFVLPYQFLLLCRLMDVKPRAVLLDFMNNLSFASWESEGKEKAREYLVNYFIEHGYGQRYYSEEDIRKIFKEMDAVSLLFPKDGKNKLVDLYANWRSRHHAYWFKNWFRKPRRKLSGKSIEN